jgi:hypothetical protein
MLAKKSVIETKQNNKAKPGRQIGWFIGLYLASVAAMGLFYGFSHWFVAALK